MKHTVLWLMTVLMVISCISCRSTAQDGVMSTDTTHTKTVTETFDTVQESAVVTEQPAAPVRYKLQYTVTELTDLLPDTLRSGDQLITTENTYFYGGALHAFRIDTKHVCIYAFSAEGEVSEIAVIPKPEETHLLYVAQCTETCFLLGGKANGQDMIWIVDADGTVIAQDRTDDLCRNIAPHYFIHETEDGQTAILINYYHYVTCRYLFDGQTLVRGEVIETSSYPVYSSSMQYQGNGIYISLSFADSGAKLDVNKMYTTPYALRIPSNRASDDVLFDAAGEIYLDDSSGEIYKYKDDAMASAVINWIDVDIPQGSGMGGTNKVWVVNENTFFVAHPMTINGDKGNRFFYVTTAMVPDTDERTVIEIRCYELRDAWLQRAIRSFNNTNETYRAEVTFRSGYNIYEQNEDLQQTLLYEARPDLCITSANTDLTIFYDKGAFCDLLPRYEDSLLGCVKDARQFLDALYTIPMRMQIETFACPADVCDGFLTWSDFRAIASSLSDDEMLYTASLTEQTAQHIFNNALLDYVSFKNAFSFYNTDEFREMLVFTKTMEDLSKDYYGFMLKDDLKTASRYGITVPVMDTLFADGQLKFLTVQLDTVEAIMVSSLLLDEDFNWCGYPSEDGGGAYVYPDLNCSVFADTDAYDGCIAFLDHLLSVELQTDDTLTKRYLPVTVDGIRSVLEEQRYWYYEQSVYDAVGDPNVRMTPAGVQIGAVNDYLPVSAAGYSKEYIDNFGPQKQTEGNYVVLELTEEMQARFLDFLENCRMKANTDQTILSIVEEELSYWEGGVRTLEETTNIIDRRVWIYLNE